jgi:hypothetical protein
MALEVDDQHRQDAHRTHHVALVREECSERGRHPTSRERSGGPRAVGNVYVRRAFTLRLIVAQEGHIVRVEA